MLLCAEYILPITADPIEAGAVLVRDGKIADIGTAVVLRARYPEEEMRDYGQAAILPGFVNVHTHLEYTAMRGIVHDVPYAEWLVSVHSKGDTMTPAELESSAIMGALEGLSAGITCMADITPTGAAMKALQRMGMRGVIYREVNATDKRRVDFAMNQAKADIAHWQEYVDPDRLSIGIAPGALYKCHPSIFKKISEFAKDTIPVAMHVAGSREEYRFIRSGTSAFSVDSLSSSRGYVEIPPWLPTGVTPINYALNWDAFEVGNMLAIHCVHVSDDDIAKLREYDIAVGICSRCNAQLGMGVAPMREYLKADLRMGLGTDSPAATDSADMLLEMRTGMLVQRAVERDFFLTAQTMLELATIGGARALRMDDKIGSLEVGKLADIIVIDMSSSHQTPTSDPVSALVNTTSSTDVIMSMVGGNVLYEQNQWNVDLDVAYNIARVIEARGRLRN